MAVRDDFSAGEVLAAADLNDTFAEKLPYSYGTATPSTTTDGFLWYDENDTPPTPKFWDGAAFQALSGGGKVLQVVRATDTTDRSTTSSSFVDVTGMSVSITPSDTSSVVLIIASFLAYPSWTGNVSSGNLYVQITDASNNAISGAETSETNFRDTVSSDKEMRLQQTLFAWATPATTSSVTYKLRFRKNVGTGTILNAVNTGQMFAIEVGA